MFPLILQAAHILKLSCTARVHLDENTFGREWRSNPLFDTG